MSDPMVLAELLLRVKLRSETSAEHNARVFREMRAEQEVKMVLHPQEVLNRMAYSDQFKGPLVKTEWDPFGDKDAPRFHR